MFRQRHRVVWRLPCVLQQAALGCVHGDVQTALYIQSTGVLYGVKRKLMWRLRPSVRPSVYDVESSSSG